MDLDWVGFGLDDIALKRLDGMAMGWVACLKRIEAVGRWIIS